MEWIKYLPAFIILLCLILAWFAMWNSNDDRLTEQELYGDDGADEWQRKQMGLSKIEYAEWLNKYCGEKFANQYIKQNKL